MRAIIRYRNAPCGAEITELRRHAVGRIPEIFLGEVKRLPLPLGQGQRPTAVKLFADFFGRSRTNRARLRSRIFVTDAIIGVQPKESRQIRPAP